ncbi:hypothetical protein [Fulvitalea axinellae]|uniref:hypothetical protein n=1 Tax=Fulvitalea axinellae TaxID=1182444 RepID=UPI0030CA2D01
MKKTNENNTAICRKDQAQVAGPPKKSMRQSNDLANSRDETLAKNEKPQHRR